VAEQRVRGAAERDGGRGVIGVGEEEEEGRAVCKDK
jgi:hypothetical protein